MTGTQDRFETVYRGRQGCLHHASYMRMSKVLLAIRTVRRLGASLSGLDIFDYGFGAGTFFRHCPTDARLFGVELDPIVSQEVSNMLSRRSFRSVDLRPIDSKDWKTHSLMQRQYDFFLCSHVLEHLPDPVEFLRSVHSSLKPGAIFMVIVPINELVTNPHHLHAINRSTVSKWAADSGYEIIFYEESDPFLYWAQPLYAATSGWKHKTAQALSLVVGCLSALLGERLWFRLGPLFEALTFSKSTQAVFVLRDAPAAAARLICRPDQPN